MRFLILFALFIGLGQSTLLHSQRSFTKDGTIHFVSDTPLEKIEAINRKGTCVLDQATGQVQMAILIKSFHFDKALMEEHFNENYMESDKFPKAVFKGHISNYDQFEWEEGEEHQVEVIGKMTIHGVTQDCTIPGTLACKNNLIEASSSFEINAEDYDINIPGIVRKNIAESIQIDVDLSLKPLVQ